ncbi:MAG TPA: DUF305 domain-containing protein [Terriglobales bacterium]|jgi:uncharacterized protein (DUF305 family)|nr:DUF305 domain-containing protein [Terriglobales bacterium]
MKQLWLFTIVPISLILVTMSAGRETKTDSAWSELGASMQKMHAAIATIRPSGDSDVDFVRLMLPHHQAALDMAKTQLMNGKDPQMRRLAQEIITDQQSEIELMQLWLKQHPHGTQSDQEK